MTKKRGSHGVHRSRFLLSGVTTCGCCGGDTVVSKDRYGWAARRRKGTCGNSRTTAWHEIAGRMLEGL